MQEAKFDAEFEILLSVYTEYVLDESTFAGPSSSFSSRIQALVRVSELLPQSALHLIADQASLPVTAPRRTSIFWLSCPTEHRLDFLAGPPQKATMICGGCTARTDGSGATSQRCSLGGWVEGGCCHARSACSSLNLTKLLGYLARGSRSGWVIRDTVCACIRCGPCLDYFVGSLVLILYLCWWNKLINNNK